MNIIKKIIVGLVTVIQFVFDTIVRKIFGPKIYSAEDVEGKVVVITGANSGIGKAAALEFAKRKAKVVMACRNMKLAKEAQAEVTRLAMAAPDAIDLVHLDLADMDSVRKCADVIGKKYPAIHILVANAGYSDFAPKLTKTKDGFEQHIAVNHLGHFLLTNLLIPNLRNAAPSRVVVTASTMQKFAELDVNDLMMENSRLGLENTIPYANAKLCNSMFANTLAEKLKGTGVTTYSVCPGMVETGFFRHLAPEKRSRAELILKVIGLSPEQGVEVIMYCALAKELSLESGKFYRFCSKKYLFNSFLRRNRTKALQLWDLSERLVKLKK